MLPHEAEVMAEIATKYHVQFEAMTPTPKPSRNY